MPSSHRIRRQFSSLSTYSSSSASHHQNANKSDSLPSKSVSPPPLLVGSSTTFLQSASIDDGFGKFDMGSNLEAYKQRCKALEAENWRLMANQGKIITDSNRRLDCHLEEIRWLKEQMDAQRKTNVDQMRWAKLVESDCRRAKELANEWQKFGQKSTQLMKKELLSSQLQMNQLRAKCAKLGAENTELRRLCLYLDEQRQASWAELIRLKATTSATSHREDPLHHRLSTTSCPFSLSSSSSEDAGCCGSSGADSPSSSNSVSSLEGRKDGGVVEGDRMNVKEGDELLKIQVDLEQEELLKSICTELKYSMTSSMDWDEQQRNELEGTQKGGGEGGASLGRSTSQKACPNEQRTREYHEQSEYPPTNHTVESQKYVSVNNGSFGTMGHFERKKEDCTELEVTVSPLEVRELCTITEEEDAIGEKTESGILGMLGQLDYLGRNGHGFDGEKDEEDDEERMKGLQLNGFNNRKNPDGTNELLVRQSLCSSMLVDAGSMLTSTLSMEDQTKQQKGCEHNQPLEEASMKDAQNFLNGNDRRGIESESDTSTSIDVINGEKKKLEPNGDNCKEDDDDLPPQMPLISVVYGQLDCPHLNFVHSSSRWGEHHQRCSSSMEVSASRKASVHCHSSTLPLPRASLTSDFDTGHSHSLRPSSIFSTIASASSSSHSPFLMDDPLPPFSPRPLRKTTTVIKRKNSANSERPIRIRVRPPPPPQQLVFDALKHLGLGDGERRRDELSEETFKVEK